MYVLASQIKGLPIISLQTGQPVATVDRPIVSQANLEIMALQCSESHNWRRRVMVVLMRDIRQLANDCVIIDSADDISDAAEIVRLKEVLERNFEPAGRRVVNESGHRLGKVEDYTVNLKTNLVQKLYVHQSPMRSLLFKNLIVDRTQIIDVTDKQFTVRDATTKEPALATAQPAPPLK